MKKLLLILPIFLLFSCTSKDVIIDKLEKRTDSLNIGIYHYYNENLSFKYQYKVKNIKENIYWTYYSDNNYNVGDTVDF